MSDTDTSGLAAVTTTPWTDVGGLVHEREIDADHTLCGIAIVGDSNQFAAETPCAACIDEGNYRYSLRTVCGVNFRVTGELEKRVPQQSDAARPDRTMRSSGWIPPEPWTRVFVICVGAVVSAGPASLVIVTDTASQR